MTDADPTCHYAGHFPSLPETPKPTGAPTPSLAELFPHIRPTRKQFRRVVDDQRDITGESFGLLRAKEKLSSSNRGSMWRAECENCRRECVFSYYEMTKGARTSCGSWGCRRVWRARQVAAKESG
jgi:hypothetical protein